MGLRLEEAEQRQVDSLDPELRAAAEAVGLSLRGRLIELRPGLTRLEEGTGAGEATLAALELDREGPPDAVSLAACLAAHRAYVAARGDADGVSVGALALARLLVWAQRAAMLGPAPKLPWLGPAARVPEPGAGQHTLGARAAVTVAGETRAARAVALVSASP